MAEHVSALVLDTAAAELPVEDSAREHLQACAECRTRLEAVKHERQTLMKSARFASGLERLAPAKAQTRWAPRVIGLALAACLLVLVGLQFLSGGSDGVILKASPTVELLRDGKQAVSVAHPGDKLSLAVGGAGYTQVVVVALSESGETSVIQPPAPLERGARVQIGKLFEVTPGSFAIIACFDDQPLLLDSLRNTLETEAGKQRAAGRTTLETPVPKLSRGICAKTFVVVEP